MKLFRTSLFMAASLVSGVALVACGGGNAKATIAAQVSGLLTSPTVQIVLQNNGTDTVTASSTATTSSANVFFPTTLGPGSAYNVTVAQQPVGETCTVGNGAGTVDAYADSVVATVACTVAASVGGTVSGLASGQSVTLSNTSTGTSVAVASNGAFALTGLYGAGTAYNVVVTTQPASQTCTVTNGSGTTVLGTMANVLVACK